jgi:hypothetical protein
MPGLTSLPRSTSEEFLAALTTAAYGVALRNGFRQPFLEVELELWRALRSVFRQEGWLPDAAGEHASPPGSTVEPVAKLPARSNGQVGNLAHENRRIAAGHLEAL